MMCPHTQTPKVLTSDRVALGVDIGTTGSRGNDRFPARAPTM